MKIKVEDLTKEQLNEWVARARGIKPIVAYVLYDGTTVQAIDGTTYLVGKAEHDYRPTINKSQWAELIQKFLVDVLHNEDSVQAWACHDAEGNAIDNPIDCFAPLGEEGVAVCRAVITSAFGEFVEVPDEPAG